MVSVSQNRSSFVARLNPLAGINWQEVAKAYQIFWKDPAPGILHILAAGRNSRWEQWVNDRRARQAAALAGIMVTIDLAALLPLPEDTLGGAYARDMVQQGFDPQTFIHEGDTWVSRRMALAHDVHHTLTGFDHSGPGEMGLAAFEFLQSWDLLNAFVLSHTLLALLVNFPTVTRFTLRGFWLGLRAKPLFAYPYEQNWAKPLVEVRRELGLVP